MKKLLFIFLSFLFLYSEVHASTILVSGFGDGTCSIANVQDAINSAADASTFQTGDTVVVPAGSCDWTTGAYYTQAITIPDAKAITLQGSGIGVTIITQTEGYELIEFNNASRITGFTFKEGKVKATGQDWRIDHNRFESVCATGTTSIAISAENPSTNLQVRGVADNNQFHNLRNYSRGYQNLDNASWATALSLGDVNAPYFEDNTFTYSSCATIQAQDASYGGSYVFRNNAVQDASVMAHAVQGLNRAARRWEVYNNVFTAVTTPDGSHANFPGFVRAGTGLWFGNELVGGVGATAGNWSNPVIQFDEQRSCWSTAYSVSSPGNCDGNSPWDQNTVDATGYACRDQIGRGYDTVQWVSTFESEGAYAQPLVPAYSWENVRYPTEADRLAGTNGVAISFIVKTDICAAAKAHIVENRDFYNASSLADAKTKGLDAGYAPYGTLSGGRYYHPLRDDIPSQGSKSSAVYNASGLTAVYNASGMTGQ